MIDAAVGTLPDIDAADHRDSDGKNLVQRALVVRIDAGGCSATLAAGLAKRNIGFAVSARSTPAIEAAIGRVVSEPGRWHNSPKRPKQRKRSGAQVADLTDLVDLSDWPTGTRLVVRRGEGSAGFSQGGLGGRSSAAVAFETGGRCVSCRRATGFRLSVIRPERRLTWGLGSRINGPGAANTLGSWQAIL